jgi:hypothetical protein
MSDSSSSKGIGFKVKSWPRHVSFPFGVAEVEDKAASTMVVVESPNEMAKARNDPSPSSYLT